MGINKVLIPEKNMADLKEIESPSLKQLEIVPIREVGQVFEESLIK